MPAPEAPAHPQSDIALYGRDDMPRIVDVHPLMHGGDRGGRARVRLYQRSPDFQRVEGIDETFFPFFFLSDITLLRGFGRDRFKFQRLDGDNFFRYLVVFTTWSDYWDAVRQIERRTDSDQRRPEELYLVGSPAQQYMMQTGRTCFQDMTLDDLHRMQLDIEVYSEDRFPNAERPEDEIIIIALSDNRGWTKLLHQRPGISEALILKELVQVVTERDPDVIEGHNIFAFDWDYIRKRCDLLGVDLTIGRDGSAPRVFDSSMRFAERTVDFPAMDIAGRHIIDTYFQVMSFDVFKRDLPDYSLKTAARYFGFAPEDRTYIEGADIAQAWTEDRDALLDYALDDVIETERLARHLSGSSFYLTQMLPMTYGSAARRGPASKIESLFVREYMRRRHSIPQSEWGSQSMGGYTDIFVTGVVGPIVYADVESLYPSIMLNYDIQPDGDDLGLFPDLLDRLTTLRLDTKQDMKAAADEETRSELDARQSSYKILINCFDPETEIMTLEGAKNIRDVEVGDLVYSINPDTLETEIKPVTKTYEQKNYSGPMVRLENRFVDFLVTPNHRLLTNRVNGYRETGYRWIEAENLFDTKCRHRLPPRPALEDDGSTFSVDSTGLKHRFNTLFGGASTTEEKVAVHSPKRDRGNTPVLKPEHRKMVDYEGSIHCISVADNHTVLAGRNGKFNWIGQSFYGQLGFTLAAFNDFAEADRVARVGQDILRQLIRAIQGRGGIVIEVDTDGVLFVPPEGVRGEEAEIDFTRSLTEALPEGIRVGFDGRFRRMLSYKKKNYALLTYDGTLKFKGSSLISRSNERFGRRFVRQAIRLLLDEDIAGLHQLYIATRDQIVEHDWRSVDSFARTESLKDTIEQYEQDVESGKRPRAAAYELAKQQSDATGQPIRKGDRISYYITGSSANVTAFENCKLARHWDPDDPDENTAYYLKRLDEFTGKFEPFFDEPDFRLVFSPEDLFGFTPDGIEIREHHHDGALDPEPDDEVPF